MRHFNKKSIWTVCLDYQQVAVFPTREKAERYKEEMNSKKEVWYYTSDYNIVTERMEYNPIFFYYSVVEVPRGKVEMTIEGD